MIKVGPSGLMIVAAVITAGTVTYFGKGILDAASEAQFQSDCRTIKNADWLLSDPAALKRCTEYEDEMARMRSAAVKDEINTAAQRIMAR